MAYGLTEYRTVDIRDMFDSQMRFYDAEEVEALLAEKDNKINSLESDVRWLESEAAGDSW